MTIKPAAKAALDELLDVLLERHLKYGAGNVSGSPGGPLNGLRVRMHDKLARISNYVDNGAQPDFDDDKLRDSFVDLANYGVIGLLVLDGQWPGVEPAGDGVVAEPDPHPPFTQYRDGEADFDWAWNGKERCYAWTSRRTGNHSVEPSIKTIKDARQAFFSSTFELLDQKEAA